MRGDRRIEEAIQAGEKNKRTWELVQNWCANVQMKKFGGTGMVEQMTGLPIGNHFLECPHAPAGGMAAFDLADTALDFHDRNCVDCMHRKPVGMPNLTILLKEREEQRAKHRLEQERADSVVASKLAAREAARLRIRAHLNALAATTLDLVSELDHKVDGADHRLAETAELAPETFTPEIVDHLFSLVESNEHWLVTPCLTALARLDIDKPRLTNAALRALRSLSVGDIAGDIVQAHGEHGDSALVADALPSLIRLANPISSPFGFDRQQQPVTGPLDALYRYRKDAVRAGLRLLLEDTRAYNIRLAARGLDVLVARDATLTEFLAPELISKIARANRLVLGSEEEVSETLDEIRSVLTRTFHFDPEKTDRLIAAYFEGASAEGGAQLYKIYDSVLRDVRFGRGETQVTEAHRIAFRRLVVAATEATTDEIADATDGSFHGDPYELTPIAAEEIDLLLGCAALLDVKLTDLDATPPDASNPMAGWDRIGRRGHLSNMMSSFVRWACIAAGETDTVAVEKVLTFLRGLPEASTRLRGEVTAHFHELMRSTEGLTLCLPDYYTALVGASQLVRSCAATALGEMRFQVRDNLPSLVFEAFTALLTDPYIIVHRGAVRALDRFHLPDTFDALARQALSNIIVHYARERGDDEFLMTAIDLYAQRYTTTEKLAAGVGARLVEIMSTLTPYVVAKELRFSRGLYAASPGFLALLLRMMNDPQAMSLYHEDLLRELKQQPIATLHRERAALLALGTNLLRTRETYVAVALLELLTAAGAWSEAAALARVAYEGIEDTTRNRQIRLSAALRMMACAYELAITTKDEQKLTDLSAEWRKTLAEIEKDHAAHEERRDPLRGLRRPH
jgi:hypothetical protein